MEKVNLKLVIKKILKESITFDQRSGHQTTNKEWLDWEKEVIQVEKELKFLGKKIHSELVDLEEVLGDIIKNLFDTGEVSHIGLVGDTMSTLSNTPMVRTARERTDNQYNEIQRTQGPESLKKQQYLKYLYYKKECEEYRKLVKSNDKITSDEKQEGEEACRHVKYTPMDIKTYSDKQNTENIQQTRGDTPTEKVTPKWYYIIQKTRNKMREILYSGPSGLSINMWDLFLRKPLQGGHPLPEIPNLTFLNHSLDEMPKKVSNILKEKIPQNLSKEMKKIVELKERYEELLELQPVHFVK